MYLKFVEVFLCGGSNRGLSLVLMSIKHIEAFCLYIHTNAFTNDKANQWGRERGGEREGDTMSERGRGREGLMQEREREGGI
jgi:hypothetical protein